MYLISNLNKISESSNYVDDNFIDNYLSVLSKFIKNIEKQKENNNLSEIKIYLSEIFYSLENFFVEEEYSIKIRLILEQMKKFPFLLYDNKDLLKEVIIINEENKEKEIKYNFNDVIIERYVENYYSNSDEYIDDYNEIEDYLISKKDKKKNYY